MEESRWVTDDTDLGARTKQRPTVALVVPAGSYRTTDFVEAASALRVDLVVASNGAPPMGELGPSRSITVDFNRQEWSAKKIAGIMPAPDAVISADDQGVVIAALASNMLGIPANPVAAVSSTRDKAHMRALLDAAEVPQPRFGVADRGEVAAVGEQIGFPCVIKPRGLSASRGVIRVDTRAGAEASEDRIREIVACTPGAEDLPLLVESFVSGPEAAVEGMLTNGVLSVLAILDKPDSLEGPYFEETMFITPSRHDEATQAEIVSITQAATDALGLVSGPVHAEVRLGADGVALIEIAARSIGGLCGRSLSFGLLSESLETLILRSALGLPGSGLDRAAAATGVLMLPIPEKGNLAGITGVEEALAVDGITDFSQTIPNGKHVEPLPEGDRYLGFVFAEGLTPEAVEHSLREAQNKLVVSID